MKLNDIINLNNAIRQVIDNTEIKISIVCKFRLLTNLKVLETPIVTFDTVKNESILKYGKENEDGSYSISKEDKESFEKFNAEINPLLVQDYDVQLTKIKVEDIIIDGINSDLLMVLYPIIEE